MTAPWAQSVQAVVDDHATDPTRGLTSAEAAARLRRDGPNELPESRPPTLLQRFAKQFTDPMVVLLLGAIVVSLLAWWSDGAESAPIEAIVIAAIVVANAVLGVWQEGRASDAVAALRRLSALRSTVVRDGHTVTIPSRDIVVGDLVVLTEGDAVPADGRIVDNRGIEVSEAALTGESLPVPKRLSDVAVDAVVGDRWNMAFSGTAVTKGQATCVVTATALDTEVGRISSLLDDAIEERTPLERQIERLSRFLGIVVVALAAVVVGAIFVTSDIATWSDALDALLVAVSLAVAAVPEGLPAILTVVLALGVQRMAQRNAIVKRLLSVETLGAASVICTDKTGTLTRNEMTAVRLSVASGGAGVSGTGYDPDGRIDVDARSDETRSHDPSVTMADLGALLRGAVAANDATFEPASEQPSTSNPGSPAGEMSAPDEPAWIWSGDPTEIALLVAARKHPGRESIIDVPPRFDEIPFDSDRKLMTTLHTAGSSGPWEQFTKGAPDVLLARCTHELVEGAARSLTADRRAEIMSSIDAQADDGLRTLAVASRSHPIRPEMLDEGHEHELTFLGVVGIADPAKTEVLPSIAEAQRAGVRTVMVTGDHPRTARAIARSLGMDVGPASVIAGADMSGPGHLDAVIDDASVFARVTPEDKLDIVDAYQRAGHIVAMTGDGVNDAPALRQADIGVAMGRGGTEVARDAADMILADDDFRTIVRAIREGREIFADIRKFLRYLLASNCGEVLVMIIGVIAAAPLGLAGSDDGLAVPLLATQILWINLLTDSALALALGVDPAVDDVMTSPPRAIDTPIVDRPMWTTIGLIGVTTAIAGLVAMDLELSGGFLGGDSDLTTSRTMLFTTVVLAQVFNAFNARSDVTSAFVDVFGNRLLWAAVAVTVALQVAVVHAGPLNRAFSTTPLGVDQWLVCLGLSSSVLLVDEVRKLVVRRRSRPVGPVATQAGGLLRSVPGVRQPHDEDRAGRVADEPGRDAPHRQA